MLLLILSIFLIFNTASALTLHGRCLTFHGNPDTCITITSMWDDIDTISVIYDRNITLSSSDTITSFSGVERHHVELNGLQPSTRYYYQIQDLNGNCHTDIDSFNTAHPLGTQTDLILLMVGDFQPRETPAGQAERDSIRVFIDTVRTQIAQGRCPHPDLILNLGDWISSSARAAWDTAFALLDTLHELAPLLPTIGNHDGFVFNLNSPWGYIYHFNLPPSGLGSPIMGDHQYVLDYQNVRFINLSVCDQHRYQPQDQVASGSLQYSWLESVLAATPPEIDHIIEMHHVSMLPLPWNIKNSAPNNQKTTWQQGIFNDPLALNTAYDTLRYEYYRDMRPLLEAAHAISIEGHAYFCCATTAFAASHHFGNLPVFCCGGGNGWNTEKQSFCCMHITNNDITVNYHKVDNWPGPIDVAAGYPWQAAATSRIFTIHHSPEYGGELYPQHLKTAINSPTFHDITLSIQNTGLKTNTYTLTVHNIPPGWTTTLKDPTGSTTIDSIGPLSWGQTADFLVHVTADSEAQYGEYPINVIAESRYSPIPLTDTSRVAATICSVYTLPFIENFDHESTFPPCWTIIDGGSNRNSPAGWQPYLAVEPDGYGMTCDSDAEGSGSTQDEELISPVLDCSGTIGVYMKYWHHFSQYTASAADIDISINHQPWQNIVSYTDDDQGTRIHNISPWAADQHHVRIRFHYTASYDWWWKIDSVSVYSYIPDRIEDLTIQRTDTSEDTIHITLNWSSFPGASRYYIYKSTTNWQTGWVLIDSTANTTYTDPLSQESAPNSFYYVTANNASLNDHSGHHIPSFIISFPVSGGE